MEIIQKKTVIRFDEEILKISEGDKEILNSPIKDISLLYYGIEEGSVFSPPYLAIVLNHKNLSKPYIIKGYEKDRSIETAKELCRILKKNGIVNIKDSFNQAVSGLMGETKNLSSPNNLNKCSAKDKAPNYTTQYFHITEKPFREILSIEDFKEQHYKVLRQLNGHPVNERFTGMITTEVDIDSFIPVLMDLGLIRIGTYDECLRKMKVEALKGLLMDNGLKVSGKKEDLIKRIISNIKEEEFKKNKNYKEIYMHTSRVESVIEDFYTKQAHKKIELLRSAIKAINNGDLNKAFAEIYSNNVALNSFNFDTNSIRPIGIPEQTQKVYLEELRKNRYDISTELAIYAELSGDSIFSVVSVAKKAFEYENIEESSIRYESSLLSTLREISNAKMNNVKKIIFTASLDERTCSICGKLDGKSINIENGQIGVNIPPMHIGCRCTIVSGDWYYKSGQRRIWNPNTRKSELVPYLTYNQWKKKYLKKD